MRAGCVALACTAAWLFAAAAAVAAQDAERPPLANTDFNVDLVAGPVLGVGRIVGLGGAFTALASGVEGGGWNVAAYASRGHWDIDWFEWDVTLNLVPRMIRSSDFDNNGETGFTHDEFLFFTAGAGVQFGEFGLGGLVNVQSYDLRDGQSLLLQIYNYGAAYALADGQLVVGLGLRTVSLAISEQRGPDLVNVGGTAPEGGAILRLADERFRLGVNVRLPVESDASDSLVAAGLTLPRHVHLPWELQLGAAWQFGPRPLNRKFVNPHDLEEGLRAAMLRRRSARARAQYEREAQEQRMQLAQERSMPLTGELQARDAEAALPEGTPRDPDFWRDEARVRWQEERELLAEIARLEQARKAAVVLLARRYLLVSGDVVLVGPTTDGVGLESFLSQQQHVSGRDTTVGFRAGIEGEPIAHWVQMRAGTYFEPSRFDGVGYRVHGTLGFNVRLFSWDLFDLIDEFTLKLGASADVAERYLNVGFGLGLWH